MKLNTPLFSSKRTQETYPTKRSMNLYYRPDRTTAPATTALYVLFGLVVLLALGKFLVFDPWSNNAQLKEREAALEAQTTTQMAELKDYNTVHEAYLRLAPTDEELSQADVMDILALVDDVVRPQASVSQFTFSDNQVLLTFSGVTLRQAADLVAQLEQSPLVVRTSVDTASSEENRNLVEVNVYFEVAPKEESQS